MYYFINLNKFTNRNRFILDRNTSVREGVLYNVSSITIYVPQSRYNLSDRIAYSLGSAQIQYQQNKLKSHGTLNKLYLACLVLYEISCGKQSHKLCQNKYKFRSLVRWDANRMTSISITFLK